jgi:hypothetical protein
MPYNTSIVANSDLVSSCHGTFNTKTSSVTTQTEIIIYSSDRQNSSITKSNAPDSMSTIRRNYESEGISRNATNIILASWRRSTQKQYATYISKWILLCDKRKINSVCPTLNQVLEFLNSLFESGLSYSAINSARSALSAYGINFNHVPVGSNAIIIRFMKGVYNLRPSEPKYCKTWDVSNVLGYLRKLSPIKFISLKDLTLKLVMLIAIITASRVQSLYLLTLNGLEKNFHSYTIFFDGLLKQNRPSWSQNCIELFAYPPDRRLCVTFVLKEYLKQTAALRKDCKKLFISYVKPHGQVSRDTISRWLKIVMTRGGIDVKKFSSHSVRSAAVSKASAKFVSVDKVLKVAGWSNAKTFAKFYKKPIETSSSVFQNVVLKP